MTVKTVDVFIEQNGRNFWSTYHDPGGYNPSQIRPNPFPKKPPKEHLTGKVCFRPLGNRTEPEGREGK